MTVPYAKYQIRSGAYYDSVTLMQLQKALVALPDVADAGVMMATPANCELLTAAGFDLAMIEARPDDLLIIIKAETNRPRPTPSPRWEPSQTTSEDNNPGLSSPQLEWRLRWHGHRMGADLHPRPICRRRGGGGTRPGPTRVPLQ